MENGVEYFSYQDKIRKNYVSHIEKLIRSKSLRRSRNSLKILKYYRKKILEDNVHYISEKIIAFEVFEKNVEYDPTVDSFIRVMFHRFRNSLEEYYLFEGDTDDIELYFPKGTYVPHFRKRFIQNKAHADLPFFMHRKLLIEKILASLRSVFMVAVSEQYLDLILEYYKSLDDSSKNAYVEAVFFETVIYGKMLFLREPDIPFAELKKRALSLFHAHKNEEHTYLPVMLICIIEKEYETCIRLAEELYDQTDNPYYKGLACIGLASLTSSESLLIELQCISDVNTQISIFWHLPKIVYYAREKKMYDIMYTLNNINIRLSQLSKVLYIVMKNKIMKLSQDDEKYIAANKKFFSAEYLSNFLFEMADEYSIE